MDARHNQQMISRAYWNMQLISSICAMNKTKQEVYLSNIKALRGLLAPSRGGGILSTIALRISVIPIPS